MSQGVCYLARSGRGDRLAEVRLIGEPAEGTWEVEGEGADSPDVQGQIAGAADWLSQRLQRAGERELRVLCVDVEGSTCSWLTAPSAEPTVVAAALASADGAVIPANTAESSIEALAPAARPARRGPAGPGQRLAVMAVPDVSARLLIDMLDERGVEVHTVLSLWHAMSAAWNPAPEGNGERLVATSESVVAVVLVDPAGRLVWAWSRGGELLAAGTIRLVQPGGDEGPVRVTKADVGRLTADWLAWSAQLGAAPARVVCMSPQMGGADGLDPGGLGAAIGAAWAGATVDLAVHEDPVGVTLRRVARTGEREAADSRRALVRLSHRPGRAHRAWHWWRAGVALLVALALSAVAWKAWSAAGHARRMASDVQEGTKKAIATAVPGAGTVFPEKKLESELSALRVRRQGPRGIDQAKPILSEMETLSAVLGSLKMDRPALELKEVQLLAEKAQVQVEVPDTDTAEELSRMLDSIAGTSCQWLGSFSPQGAQAGKLSYKLQGKWKAGGP